MSFFARRLWFCAPDPLWLEARLWFHSPPLATDTALPLRPARAICPNHVASVCLSGLAVHLTTARAAYTCASGNSSHPITSHFICSGSRFDRAAFTVVAFLWRWTSLPCLGSRSLTSLSIPRRLQSLGQATSILSDDVQEALRIFPLRRLARFTSNPLPLSVT